MEVEGGGDEVCGGGRCGGLGSVKGERRRGRMNDEEETAQGCEMQSDKRRSGRMNDEERVVRCKATRARAAAAC